jgi:hypothetical protein
MIIAFEKKTSNVETDKKYKPPTPLKILLAVIIFSISFYFVYHLLYENFELLSVNQEEANENLIRNAINRVLNQAQPAQNNNAEDLLTQAQNASIAAYNASANRGNVFDLPPSYQDALRMPQIVNPLSNISTLNQETVGTGDLIEPPPSFADVVAGRFQN